jgi:hypothetical protein
MDKHANKSVIHQRVGLALICVFVILAFSISSSKSPPKNTLVFVDNDQHTYIAPPCVTAQKDWTHYSRMTIGQADNLGFKPNPTCTKHGVFEQKDRTLGGLILEKIGILKPLPSRWNSNGSWNW